jgi:DNA topoisomerase-3
VIARAYLASVMPDFRYRQTTATIEAGEFPFKAIGRQPLDLGWRATFPEWQPADERGDDAQLLPVMNNGDTAQLLTPTIEDKETRPPPRYTEGTLIEAMQNAWRFVDDEILRDRLKEAKGIGTPATRAEIIGGLKRQDFLTIQAKNIVPTATGMTLYGVLRTADPALVDPGVTAQLECLLDDVVVGKQEMIGAINAVCDVALRIIGKLKDGAQGGLPPLFGETTCGGDGARPPTPAMKRYAITIARQKRIKLPAGYAVTGSICRGFLEQHAPRKADAKTGEAKSAKTPSEDASTLHSTTQKKRIRKSRAGVVAVSTPAKPVVQKVEANTPLRIPFGNKETALKLGARYGTGGWYAPPGVNLEAFSKQGWL